MLFWYTGIQQFKIGVPVRELAMVAGIFIETHPEHSIRSYTLFLLVETGNFKVLLNGACG